MFEVPEWAECAVSSVTDRPACLRRLTKMVTVLMDSETEPSFQSKGTCNLHVEIVEMKLSECSSLPPITVSRKQFPEFMEGMMEAVDTIVS